VTGLRRRSYIFGTVAALAVTAALAHFYGGSQAPVSQLPIVRLTPANVSQVEATFNAAKGDVRLLVLLSPT
jgi:hypothetical protein